MVSFEMQRTTLHVGGFIEIAFTGGKFQPIEFYKAKVAAAELMVAEQPCTKSMGNLDFLGFLLIRSSHLCNH